MNRRQSVPEPVIVTLQGEPEPLTPRTASQARPSTETRQADIDAFLQAKALTARSQKAYRQDLQQFLNWTTLDWAEITPRHIAQFRAYLLQKDLVSGQRLRSDATVRRILGTLKQFYGWLTRSRILSFDPTTELELPKVAPPQTAPLHVLELEQIYQAGAATSLPARNVALISVLLHGLRAEEVSALNIADYDGQRLWFQEQPADGHRSVPLTAQGKVDLERYLQWREEQGEVLSPKAPLFVSHSRRNRGQRLGYEGIRKVIDGVSKQTRIDFHTYQLRHTFAMHLVANGMNPYQVMALTRHQSVQSFRRYTQAIEQTTLEAAFDAVMAKAPVNAQTTAIAAPQAAKSASMQPEPAPNPDCNSSSSVSHYP